MSDDNLTSKSALKRIAELKGELTYDTTGLIRYSAFCENDERDHHCGHNITDRGECYDVTETNNLLVKYREEIQRLCDEVDALRPDATLGAMLIKKAREVEALAPGIPRIIVCDAVAAGLVERLSESTEEDE